MIKTKRDTERDASHMTRGRRSRHLGRIALLCVLALVMTGVSTAGFAYLRIVGNVKETDVRKYLKNRPTLPKGKAGKALNILILGSDIRTGKSDVDGAGASGDVDGMRADTTMIMHISADRKRVYFVSIPRDTVVDIPSCVVQSADKKKTENSEPVEKTKFNSAFAIGGKEGYVPTAAACSMKTVEALTKVRLSGYVVVNFASFKSIVDELGGIPMYFPEARKDSASGLNVPAGCRLLRGDQALALARARKSIGDGSDIGRISRQQDLVKAIVKEPQSVHELQILDESFERGHEEHRDIVRLRGHRRHHRRRRADQLVGRHRQPHLHHHAVGVRRRPRQSPPRGRAPVEGPRQ